MPPPAPFMTTHAVTRHNPPTIWDSTVNGHSQTSAAEVGRLAFVSGRVAQAATGELMPCNCAGQARMVAADLVASLDELKASPRDIVLLRILVVDATKARFLEAWAPIQDMLGGELPSVTALGVQALWIPDAQLAVEMVVRVP